MKKELTFMKGSHHDIGFQHGEKLKVTINDSVIPFVLDDMKNNGISLDEAIKISRKYEALIGKRFPEVFEETKGLAEGADIDYEKAMLLLFFWEVRDTVEHATHECSSFVAAGDATINGYTIAAQNSDWPLTMIGR
jgi:hypothetical protein